MDDLLNHSESALPDDVLMQRVGRRDRDAFTVLVRRHQHALVNFFRKMGDYNSADDLAQETFVRLFRYRRKYRPKAKFTTFLYLLARRAWIDHCRALGRRKKAYEEIAEVTMVSIELSNKLNFSMKEKRHYLS